MSSTRDRASSTLGHGMSLFSAIAPPILRRCCLLSSFAMWPAFPTSDYYEDSAPRRQQSLTMCAPFSLWSEGATGAVPTFTNDRSTREMPSYTPATSPRVHRSFPRSLRPPMIPRTIEADSPLNCDESSAAPTQIHQVGVGRRLEGPHTLVHLHCTFSSRLRDRGVW